MNSKIKVSVILPVYKVEKYLERCFKNILRTTLKDIEFIFVDDASPDHSVDIIKKYMKLDDRIKLVRHQINKYTAEARNTGIKNATGEYIGFMDPDDEVAPDYFEKLYNLAKEENADIAKGIAINLPSRKIINKNNRIKKNKFNFRFFLWNAIYRRDLILKNNLKFFVDVICFHLPAVYYSNKVATRNDAIYYYWTNKGSCVNSKFTSEKWKKLNIAGAKASLDFINSVNISRENYILLSRDLILPLIYYGWKKFSRGQKIQELPNIRKYLDYYKKNNKYFKDIQELFYSSERKYLVL